MIRNILVPLDGSTFGEHALPLALSIAARANAGVQLLHVHPPLTAVYAEVALDVNQQLNDVIRQQSRDYLQRISAKVRAAGIAVQSAMLDGEIAEAIERHAISTRADLVVMTTHGRGPLGRFWMGSVVDELIRRAPLPLLLVRPREQPPDLAQAVTIPTMLVALDGSPLSEQILGPAVTLGCAMGSRFRLLRLLDPFRLPAVPFEGAAPGPQFQTLLDRLEVLQTKQRTDAESYLENVAQPLRAEGLAVECQVASTDYPALGILEAAGKPDVGAVALATHGRHGVARLFLGSVTDKVARKCPVPLLVYRPLA
jgi:nucleotide-binding universal stress UspA family protein